MQDSYNESSEEYVDDSDQQQQELLQQQLEYQDVKQIIHDESLPAFKPEDVQFFGILLEEKNPDEMSIEEARRRKVLRLLLRIKNGDSQVRRYSQRLLVERSSELGAECIFESVLPLLMSPTIEDQERHILVKLIDKLLLKLKDLVTPYVPKLLVVVEPMLMDEEYIVRVEGRELISNLSKAVGLSAMLSAMRSDIEHEDDFVRSTTARALSVVANAVGLQQILPFLRAVCNQRQSWHARHTGIRVVQQIALLIRMGVLPHLYQLVDCIRLGFEDEQLKIRVMTANAISSLAESCAPYGIEAFDPILKALWDGIRQNRGKALAAFIKAVGSVIPLMDAEYAVKYSKSIMPVVIREFQSPDDEMKRVVLRVLRQCCAVQGLDLEFIRYEVLPEYFRNFWIRRTAMDKRVYRAVVETTTELSLCVGPSVIVKELTPLMKDESEQFRKMTTETIALVLVKNKVNGADLNERLVQLLVDGVLYVYQEMTKGGDQQLLNDIGMILKSVGRQSKPYLPQLCSAILWRITNKSADVRMQACDMISRLAPVLAACEDDELLLKLFQTLNESLSEDYPDVLGSVLCALREIASSLGYSKIDPSVKDFLPKLTPILGKNRHEKVAEQCIRLVGDIANSAPDQVSAREWMRICFELIELLKAQKKVIRRAAIVTFGYIAKAIGPQDVLATLLSNLKVQERQYRVCTTIAIAIVAETCAPFTVLPALMNEYRIPEMNVQNGVLKSLAFMFEYIGEVSKDYVYAVTPLLEDALTDRDLVHRQTACTAVRHLAINCVGLDREDALMHLLNHVWPNVFDTAAIHMVSACMEAIEALSVALGSGVILYYLLQGLFHPARKVRTVYWRIYNMIYMQGSQFLVPFYPRLDCNVNNTIESASAISTYSCSEMDYIL
ncbi:hypothetical protein MP228_013086 [Amoeboaphelidium protococcarum]|nr:hypothetical protein MP228_013086 [Amoeboaphelidium protococcarum]